MRLSGSAGAAFESRAQRLTGFDEVADDPHRDERNAPTRERARRFVGATRSAGLCHADAATITAPVAIRPDAGIPGEEPEAGEHAHRWPRFAS